MNATLNKLWNKSYSLTYRLVDNFLSVVIRLGWRLRGVKLSHGCLYNGLPSLSRCSHSHIEIGSNCQFRSRSTSNLMGIRNPCILSTHSADAKIVIGNSCGFSGTVIGAFIEVRLGNNVRCGANTVITDSDWHPEDPRIGSNRPVIIGDNVWLGYGVIVLKGVTIGDNSIVGAGSIVVSDIPKNAIAGGNPCKVLKYIINE